MMRLILALLICGPLYAACTGASPNWTTTGDASSFTTCVANATEGDTITFSSDATYTTSAEVTVTKGLTILGAGHKITLSNSSFVCLLCTGGGTVVQANKAMRLSNFTITGTIGTDGALGAVKVDGQYNVSLRLDHLTFDCSSACLDKRGIQVGYDTWYLPNTQAIFGLVDHMTWTNTGNVPAILYNGHADAWIQADNFGSINAFYVEDSTFNWTGTIAWGADNDALDGEHGARTVFRHNTVNCGSMLQHDTGSSSAARGQRVQEVYSNTFNAASGCTAGSPFDAFGQRGGTGFQYDNTVSLSTTTGYGVVSDTEIWRVSDGTPTPFPWSGLCTAAVQSICGNGRPFCSTSHTPCGAFDSPGASCTTNPESGTGTGTCTNNPTSNTDCPAQSGYTSSRTTQFDNPGGSGTGYPCRDQTGYGKDNNDAARTQPLSPYYIWHNLDSNNGNAEINRNTMGGSGNAYTIATMPVDETPYIHWNKEMYSTSIAAFDGTEGIGRGLEASKPATCTVAVGWWATDTLRLFVCTSTNTWTLYYKPFTYPHPLQVTSVPVGSKVKKLNALTPD